MVAPSCPKCGKSMTLLDSHVQRYYCYKDDVVYIGSENRWIGLKPTTSPSTVQPSTQPLSPEKKREVRMIAVIGIIMIIVLLFVVPLVLYPLVAIAVVFAMRFLMSQSAGQQVRKDLSPSKEVQEISSEDKKYMKQCKSCGSWLPLASESCRSCGNKQFEVTQEPSPALTYQPPSTMPAAGPVAPSNVPVAPAPLPHPREENHKSHEPAEATRPYDAQARYVEYLAKLEELKARGGISAETYQRLKDDYWEKLAEVAPSPLAPSGAEPTAGKFCMNCGASLPTHATFCNRCGSKQ